MRVFFVVLVWILSSASVFAQFNLQGLSQAAHVERQALIAGGYPLFDLARQLNEEQRVAISKKIVSLQDCCDVSLVLVLQNEPLNDTGPSLIYRL